MATEGMTFDFFLEKRVKCYDRGGSTVWPNHCNQPLQLTIAINHGDQPLQSTIAKHAQYRWNAIALCFYSMFPWYTHSIRPQDCSSCFLGFHFCSKSCLSERWSPFLVSTPRKKKKYNPAVAHSRTKFKADFLKNANDFLDNGRNANDFLENWEGVRVQANANRCVYRNTSTRTSRSRHFAAVFCLPRTVDNLM